MRQFVSDLCVYVYFNMADEHFILCQKIIMRIEILNSKGFQRIHCSSYKYHRESLLQTTQLIHEHLIGKNNLFCMNLLSNIVQRYNKKTNSNLNMWFDLELAQVIEYS